MHLLLRPNEYYCNLDTKSMFQRLFRVILRRIYAICHENKNHPALPAG